MAGIEREIGALHVRDSPGVKRWGGGIREIRSTAAYVLKGNEGPGKVRSPSVAVARNPLDRAASMMGG